MAVAIWRPGQSCVHQRTGSPGHAHQGGHGDRRGQPDLRRANRCHDAGGRRAVLTEAGHAVTLSPSGSGALSQVRSIEFDRVLTDPRPEGRPARPPSGASQLA